MKNYLIISLLFLSVGFSQKMWHKNVMVEKKISGTTIVIIYPPNSDKPYSGVVYWFERSTLLNHQTYKNGIKNGSYKVWRYWDLEKSLSLVGNYKNGEKDGLWTYYSEDEKSLEMHYIEGYLRGKYTKWYENGNKEEEGLVIGEKTIGGIVEDGLWTYWYENGNKKEEGTYEYYGRRVGKWTFYNEDGSVKEVKEVKEY